MNFPAIKTELHLFSSKKRNTFEVFFNFITGQEQVYNTPIPVLPRGGKVLYDAGAYDVPAKNPRPGPTQAPPQLFQSNGKFRSRGFCGHQALFLSLQTDQDKCAFV